MTLRKDDPVYYKKKLTDLLKQAKDNGLIVTESQGRIIFRREIKTPWLEEPDIEQVSVNIEN